MKRFTAAYIICVGIDLAARVQSGTHVLRLRSAFQHMVNILVIELADSISPELMVANPVLHQYEDSDL